MNMLLVAGTISRMSTFDFGSEGFLILMGMAAAGSAMLVMSALLMRRHAPRACPVRRHHYAGNPR